MHRECFTGQAFQGVTQNAGAVTVDGKKFFVKFKICFVFTAISVFFLLLSVAGGPKLFVALAETHGILGDRLVVEVNNTPYTQRQLEVFLLVKESLRDDPKGRGVVMVDATNWQEALAAFGDDMLIQQEAQKLGGFTPSDKMLQTVSEVYKKKWSTQPALREAATRLGLDDRTVTRTLTMILRTEAFRRSKERQSAVASGQAGSSSPDQVSSARQRKNRDWFKDMKEQATIRLYAGAADYKMIQPSTGG